MNKEETTIKALEKIALKYFNNNCGVADLYFLIDICKDFKVDINDLLDTVNDLGYSQKQINVNLAINLVYEIAIETELDKLKIFEFDWMEYFNNGIYININSVDSCLKIKDEIILNEKDLQKHLIAFIREKDKEIIDNFEQHYTDEIPTEYTELSLDFLCRQKTICESQCDNLKIQNNLYKVWLSRMTIEDGMPYNNQVIIDRLDKNDYTWKEVYKYQAK